MLLISFNTQLAELLLTEYCGEKEPATTNRALQKYFWLAGLGFFLYPPPSIPEDPAKFLWN